ncbi:MAG: phosphatase PAP2 family protein [Opitutales bacterium]
MKTSRPVARCLLCGLMAVAGPRTGARAAEAPSASIFTRDYVDSVWNDTQAIVLGPAHWDRSDWVEAGGLAALVAGTSVFDRHIRDSVQAHRTASLDNFARQAQGLGSQYSWAVLAGFEAEGVLNHDAVAQATAMDGLTASIIASGIITPVLKYTVGRVRPNRATRTFQFKPFSGNYSFPSGHATQAFAVASVIAAHYDAWWEQGLSYGLAGLVGYARIEQNAHFASDVVAGAVIGTVVGRAVVHRHEPSKPGQYSVAPFFNGTTTGLVVARAW